MSHLILTTPSTDYAAAVSEAMWKLARPGAGGSTRYAVDWTVHPTTGDVALTLGDYTQRVDPDADVDAYVAGLPIPQGERDSVRDALNAARGSRLTVADMTPPSLAANLRTRDEMKASGWFPDNEL